jgi:hypothetical protein
VDVSSPEPRSCGVGIRRGWISAAALLLCAAPVAHAQAPAAAPTWKQLYEDSQTTYYVDAGTLPKAGPASVATLLQYKIPQVIGGAQVWSIVTRMKVNCDQNQMITIDNTLYAAKRGAGPVVESQPANDSWHAPLPGTLGGLVWSAACPKP